jgi:hypothetical protein
MSFCELNHITKYAFDLLVYLNMMFETSSITVFTIGLSNRTTEYRDRVFVSTLPLSPGKSIYY